MNAECGEPALAQWLCEPMSAQVKSGLARVQAADDVRHIGVMPDVHLAADVCNGLAIATSRLIYPNAVGGDIGCGMAAAAFDCGAEVLADRSAAGRLLAGLYERIPANRQRTRDELPEPLARQALGDPRLEAMKARDARVQLGTLGRGNHFVELQADEHDRLWVMVHSGSRAIGQAIRDVYLARATPGRGGLKWLDAEAPEGMAYLRDADWAVRYAEANRRVMVEAVARLVEAQFGAAMSAESLITTTHNHVRREEHFGRALWVHRKGAMPAGTGEPGVIPGSMGTASFHVEGRGRADSLCSSSHGAGRRMSRHDAARRISSKDLSRQMEGVWFDLRRAQFLRDEAPGAYRDIAAVMRAQSELVRIVRRLRPLLSYKGA